jgi:hypothetical protein
MLQLKAETFPLLSQPPDCGHPFTPLYARPRSATPEEVARARACTGPQLKLHWKALVEAVLISQAGGSGTAAAGAGPAAAAAAAAGGGADGEALAALGLQMQRLLNLMVRRGGGAGGVCVWGGKACRWRRRASAAARARPCSPRAPGSPHAAPAEAPRRPLPPPPLPPSSSTTSPHSWTS